MNSTTHEPLNIAGEELSLLAEMLSTAAPGELADESESVAKLLHRPRVAGPVGPGEEPAEFASRAGSAYEPAPV
ncbi:MAG: hypothetical protein ABSC05_38475 [Candidatus Solibacter sp.]|jgi:hypothetical protein